MTDTSLPGIGDNSNAINYFDDERDRLLRDYQPLDDTLQEIEAESSLITLVDSQDTKGAVTSLIKRYRELYKRIKGNHETEKAPHLERGRATDSVFFSMMERISRGSKKAAKEGEADRLNRILTDFDVREEAKERERRRLEAEEAARKFREAEQARIKAEQEAESARLAAERARKAKDVKEEIAEKKVEHASAAAVEESVAHAQAEQAYVGTLASSADIMRQRSESGVLSTMASEKFVEITDRATLDLNALRPYIPLAALETALRKYADGVGYSSDASVQIKGARFGKRPKSRVL